MERTRVSLSRLKYELSRRLRPKTYWGLMGRFKAVPAVTSEYQNTDECLASGLAVVRLLERLGVIHPDAVTLHIGSGLGRVEYHLHDRVRRCYGVDLSGSMVKRARHLVTFPNVEFRVNDGSSLSEFGDGSFDLIYSFLVFQHLPRDQFRRYVAEARAKLTSGGYFVFQMMIDETSSHPEPPPHHPYGLRYYSRGAVEKALTGGGFAEIARFDASGEPDVNSTVVGDVIFRATKSAG